MEWEISEEMRGSGGDGAGLGGGIAAEVFFYEKVMTDEQMEVLREQIGIYATISEQLFEMYNAITTQQDSIAGLNHGLSLADTFPHGPMNLGLSFDETLASSPMSMNIGLPFVETHHGLSLADTFPHAPMNLGLSFDETLASSPMSMNIGLPFVETLAGAGAGAPMTELYARKRWGPTNEQRDLLEKIFKEERGILNRGAIKGLAYSLSLYGPVTELNVLNWFYNRRAKERRNLQKVARKKKVNIEVKKFSKGVIRGGKRVEDPEIMAGSVVICP